MSTNMSDEKYSLDHAAEEHEALIDGKTVDEAERQPVAPDARPDFSKRLLVVVVFCLWWGGLYTFFGHKLADDDVSVGHPVQLSVSAEIGYLSGIVSKGLGKALGPKHSHGGKHKHGHGDHKHKDHGHKHHDHGHKHKGHGDRKPWISPQAAEEIFLSVPSNDSARAALKRYTSYAHPAGSGYDITSALRLKEEWEEALGLPVSGPEQHVYESGSAESQYRVLKGLHKLGVWVDTYYPVLNIPVHAAITLLTDPPFHAKLREDIVDGDPDSNQRDEVAVFHGLSVSGDVKGQYIYAGYGRKADFDKLQEGGVDFTGKIALVKYGGNFRGLKIKAAQEAGAIGAIIFTDPGDDGEVTEEHGYEVYPKGPARQPSSVQRGSVQFISKYPGDPSTPGEPAYKNATRLEGGNQPYIPSLPLSYEDAIPLLKALQGKGSRAADISEDWVGGLGYKGVEYWTGPSDVDLHLVNEVNTRVMPIWNTMATIPGHINDEVIVVGNHRDAWLLGAADPNSGTASQYEFIRGLGKLLKKGWRPLRTIVLASWDAEEYGLIGSTEWTEDFGKWLEKDAAAYLNLDVAVSGSNFGAAASPSLAWLLRDAASDVTTAGDSSLSVWDSQTGDEEGAGLAENFPQGPGTGVRPLGSGSDYTSFLQRYGVASGDFGYKAGAKDAVYHYHSVYDSFKWQETYSDPGFQRHVDIAKILGVATLRLADSLILPINTTQYALDLGVYLQNVQDIAVSADFAIDLDLSGLNSSIHSLVSSSASLDVQKHDALRRLRKLLPKHPKKSWSSKWVNRWSALAAKCGSHEAPESAPVFNPATIAIPPLKNVKEIKKVLEEIRLINRKLQRFESGFISEEGIQDREWYKHKGVAPGKWLGYGATTFPALTEAITIDHSPESAQKEANELAELIGHIAKRLDA